MQGIHPYLSFNGDCKAAFTRYREIFGVAEPMLFPYTDSPMAEQVAPELGDKIMHAELVIGAVQLMGCDQVTPQCPYQKPQGISVTIGVNDAAEAERLFAALAEGGSVQMPIGETFWALRFGACTDRFGIPWLINCEKAMAE